MIGLNALGFLALPALFILNLGAETVTNNPVADTTLFEPHTSNNLGGHFDVSAGTTREGSRARGLFGFDFAGRIPPSATITSASLRLTVTKVPTGGGVNSVFELRRVLQPWGEGNKTSTQGGVASAGEASWNDRLAGTASWTMPGGQIGADFSIVVSATAPVAGLGNVTFVSGPGLIVDVQAWVVNAGTNLGWALLSQSEDQPETARRFASREDPNNAPQLVIEYSLGAAELRITNISLNQSSGTVFWTGGKGPFQLQSKANLDAANWIDDGQPTQTSPAIFPVTGSASFFRVADAATRPIPTTAVEATIFKDE
ncbi:MAG: DNRLRE domain-containing protein [Verrucomicrobiota bacterium]